MGMAVMGMVRRSVAASLVALGVAALGVQSISCQGDVPHTPTPDTGAPITIGVTIALTGDLKGTGVPLQNSVRVAEQQINSFGGVLGRRVVFHVLDDTTDKGNTLRGNVQKLIDEGAVAILGPIGSGQVGEVANQDKPGPFNTFTRRVIELSGTSTSPDLSTMQPATNRYFFRTVPNDNLQGKAVALFALKGPQQGEAGATGCRKLAIVHNDDSYGNPFSKAVQAAFTGGGGTITKDQPIPTDVKPSYAAEVTAALGGSPECMAIIVYDPAGDEFIRELKAAQKANPTLVAPGFFIIGTDGIYTSDLIVNGRTNKADPSSPTVVEGIYGTNPDPNPETTEYGDFKNLYLAQFSLEQAQSDLGGQVANFYDAAVLAALAVQKAGGTTDPVKIRDALFDVSRGGKARSAKVYGPAKLGEALQALQKGEEINYTGASGDVDFDESGDVLGNYIVWKVENGQFKTVDRITSGSLK
jgi:branched-chain amino acid transport system substrate-binding protein